MHYISAMLWKHPEATRKFMFFYKVEFNSRNIYISVNNKSKFNFYRASSCANTLFAVVILFVCPSVCLSHVLCDETKEHTADILILHKRAITLVFWHQQSLAADASFPLKFALGRVVATSFPYLTVHRCFVGDVCIYLNFVLIVTHPFIKTPMSTYFASSYGWDVISRYWLKSALFREGRVTLSANFRWKGTSPPTIVGIMVSTN